MKASSIRAKGADGEREIAKLLNPIVHKVKRTFNFSEEDILNPHYQIQRNPNQCANGGADLQNTYGICIEIKRQQALNINTWWKQCEKSAIDLDEIPVLMYRQNNKKWRVVMMGKPLVDAYDQNLVFDFRCRIEISMSDFLQYFELHLIDKLR